ncbi:MAG: DEAD/DEAH box helicase [Bacteriovorax sp.]|jgi:ATP-dependent RNA helicase RhlE|nr:DEAD/DEAH box helicase [Bacteriovorax sp.]
MTSFSELKLLDPIKLALKEAGYTHPTPIQAQAIPALLEGKDLLGCAQTGTGKTAAFALPILHRLVESNKKAPSKHARVLVLTPTRELAIQVHESFITYGKNLNLKYAVVYGGVGQTPQVKSMNAGVDVLVATPGRLMDLIEQGFIKLAALEVFVLDEADRMLDMGFIHDIKKVLKLLPPKRHNLFFSATMPPEIEKLANSILINPVKVEVTPVSSTAELISQTVMYVDRENKRALLKHILDDSNFKRVIVFSRTKHGANKIVDFLEKSGIISEAIHGNKSQTARQRALENFRSGQTRVLIATDIAARGIDIDDISHVINFDLPNVSEDYVHRIGRTARAGASGVAISFCDSEEKAFLKDIEKLIGKSIPLVDDQPFHSQIVVDSRMLSKGKAKTLIDGRNTRPNNRERHKSRNNPKKK